MSLVPRKPSTARVGKVSESNRRDSSNSPAPVSSELKHAKVQGLLSTRNSVIFDNQALSQTLNSVGVFAESLNASPTNQKLGGISLPAILPTTEKVVQRSGSMRQDSHRKSTGSLPTIRSNSMNRRVSVASLSNSTTSAEGSPSPAAGEPMSSSGGGAAFPPTKSENSAKSTLPPVSKFSPSHRRGSKKPARVPKTNQVARQPTEHEVNKIGQWWKITQMRRRLAQGRVAEAAREHAAERYCNLVELRQKSKQVVERFVLHFASKLRAYVDHKKLFMFMRISTVINSFVRSFQSHLLVREMSFAKQKGSAHVMLKYWRQSGTYRRHERRRLDIADCSVLCVEETVERRDLLRREKLAWQLLTRQFTSNPGYQSNKQALLQLRLELCAAAVKLGKYEEGADFFQFGTKQLPPQDPFAGNYKHIGFRAVGKRYVFGGDESPPPNQNLSRRRSSVVENNRSFRRRSSQAIHQLSQNGGVNLAGLLGASAISKKDKGGRGAPASGAAFTDGEGDSAKRDASTAAGISFFGDDAKKMESAALSPLLIEYSNRAGAAQGDRSLVDARLQLLNQQFLYPSRQNTSVIPTVPPKQGISETFLGEQWSSWYNTNDFVKVNNHFRRPGGPMERKRSVVTRKKIGGELFDAQQKLTAAAHAHRRSINSSFADDDSANLSPLSRYSSRRSSELNIRRQSQSGGKLDDGSADGKPTAMNLAMPQEKGLALPPGSPLFSIDFEIERLLIQEYSRRMRLASQSTRFLTNLLEEMESERARDLSDLVPLSAEKEATLRDAEGAPMFRFGIM